MPISKCGQHLRSSLPSYTLKRDKHNRMELRKYQVCDLPKDPQYRKERKKEGWSLQTEHVVRRYTLYINSEQRSGGKQQDVHKTSARKIENVLGKNRGNDIGFRSGTSVPFAGLAP